MRLVTNFVSSKNQILIAAFSSPSIYGRRPDLIKKLPAAFPTTFDQLVDLLDETLIHFHSNLSEFSIDKLVQVDSLAYEVHKDQKRLSGTPYIEGHLIPVAGIAGVITAHYYFTRNYDYSRKLLHFPAELLEDYVIRAAATGYMHDTIEDSETKSIQRMYAILSRTAGDNVADSVLFLTKVDEHFHPLSMPVWINRFRYSRSLIVRAVALADRLHNLLTPKYDIDWKRNYAAQTREYYLPLIKPLTQGPLLEAAADMLDQPFFRQSQEPRYVSLPNVC